MPVEEVHVEAHVGGGGAAHHPAAAWPHHPVACRRTAEPQGAAKEVAAGQAEADQTSAGGQGADQGAAREPGHRWRRQPSSRLRTWYSSSSISPRAYRSSRSRRAPPPSRPPGPAKCMTAQTATATSPASTVRQAASSAVRNPSFHSPSRVHASYYDP